MTAQWARQQMIDAYLARVPYGLREQMRQKVANEATVSTSIMAFPRPMLVGSMPGIEQAGMQIRTSPGGSDNHTHIAYIDGFGNGCTSVDGDEPHKHSVVSFIVVPWQDSSGLVSHDHPGKLDQTGPTAYPTPDYTGEL
jgi:hypothetical protein